MKQKNKKQKMPLAGKNIYIDKKNRRIFYKKSTKQGFVIAPNNEAQFQTFSNRYLIGVLTLVIFQFILFDNGINPIFSFIAAAFAFGLCEYKYRKLLSMCPMIQNFDITNATHSSKNYSDVDPKLLILRSVLYLLLSILLIVNLFITEGMLDSMLTIAISAGASIFTAYSGIYYFITVLKTKK